MDTNHTADSIAVVGMSCRFPGAHGIAQYWENLINGVDAVRYFTDEELLDAGVPQEHLKHPAYIKAGYSIEGIEQFDHQFFGYSSLEAERIDPQQRLFLQCAWECFEDSGHDPKELEAPVGVFAGIRTSSYAALFSEEEKRTGTASGFQILIGNDKDYLTSRVSYKLNLRGPSVTVQTACSTSLVAVHMACESIRSGECDWALAGGASVSVPHRQGYFYQENMTFSPNGACRAFDANGQGVTGGNGVGCVLLKRLDLALADGDPIYAVVRGTAVNNDGQNKAGYTAPSVTGQAAAIIEALEVADVPADKIQYVETHGTATQIGDPIEIEALSRAFSKDTSRKQFCALGSVKTNVGHLGEAAGIASFIKAALSVYHGIIPPSLHFQTPNPVIQFESSPFYVCTRATQWNDVQRYAGISSFGIGGTNAHAVIESLETPRVERPSTEPCLFCLSAMNPESLREMAGNLAASLGKEVNHQDVAYTLAVGRRHFPVRMAFVAESSQEAKEALLRYCIGEHLDGLYTCVDQAASNDLLHTLAQQYVSGKAIDWRDAFAQGPYRRVSLPGYAFADTRHWKASEQESPKSHEEIADVWQALTSVADNKASAPESTMHDSLNTVAAYQFVQTLEELGAFEDPEEHIPLEGFLFQTPIMPRFNQLLQWFLDTLVRQNRLRKEDDAYFGLEHIEEDAYKIACENLNAECMRAGQPELSQEFFAYFGKLGDYLSGMMDPEESATYEMDSARLAAHYCRLRSDMSGSDAQISDLLKRIVDSVAPNGRIRLLEVGTTGPTRSVYGPAQRFEGSVEYSFAAPEGVESNLPTASDDLKAELIHFAPGETLPLPPEVRFDVVVLNHITHIIPELQPFLDALIGHMAGGGILLIQETAPGSAAHILLESLLCRIEDADLRPDSPYLDSAQMLRLILPEEEESKGFEARSAADGYLVVYKKEEAQEEEAAFAAATFSPNQSLQLAAIHQHPLLGSRYPMPIPIYETTIQGLKIDGDYQVCGIPVAPVSFFHRYASALAKEFFEQGDCRYHGKMFAPIKAVEPDTKIQCVVDMAKDSSLQFRLYSCNDAEGMNWELHYQGEIICAANALEDGEFPEAASFNQDGGIIETYPSIEKHTIVYGSGLRAISSYTAAPNGIVAVVEGLEQYDAPLLCEAAVQAALMDLHAFLDGESPKDTWFLDSYTDLYMRCESAQGPLYAIVSRSGSSDQSRYVATISIYSNDRVLLGRIKEVALVPYSAYQLAAVFPETQIGDNAETDRNLLDAFYAADPQKQLVLLQDYLLGVFSGILRLNPNEISVEDDFIQMGLDSLMFLELNQTLTRDLNVSVTAQEAFGTPYISALVEYVARELSSHSGEAKPAIMNDPVAAVGGEIVPDAESRYEPFALTNVQYAYWIGRSGILELGNVSCHFYFEVDRDELDIAVFNTAWNKVVRRHDMLRSYILPDGLQRILQEVSDYQIETIDLRGLPDDEMQARLENLRYDKSHQVISSESWPLFDITVCILPGYYRILFSIELLNADVMSIQIMFSEVDRFMREPDFSPKPLTLSFRDYILADQRLAQTEFYEADRRYWLEQVESMSEAPDLPLVKGLSDVENQRFSTLVREIDPEVWSEIKRKAAQRGITPSGLLLAVYGDILALWSSNSKFIVSLAQFNRVPYHPEVFEIVGDFTSVMIMDIDAKAGDTFTQRAKQVQIDLWSHLEHRYFDGVQVIRELARGKRAGNDALIPVVFTSVLGMGEQSEELYPWAVLGRVGYFVSQTPQVWLDNQVSESNGTLIISWDVIEELFPDGMLEDMINCYEAILRYLAASDEGWDKTSGAELPNWQTSLIEHANATEAKQSEDTLPELFLRQLEQNEARAAVIVNDRTITYGQLANSAADIAAQLRATGAQKGDLVAIVMQKGWEQVAAVMGILLAEAAYLPINADLPPHRIDMLLSESQAKYLVTQENVDCPMNGLPRIVVTPASLEAPHSGLRSTVNADDVAYVIYTSGSTGKPKGVTITHRGAVNTILDVNDRFGVQDSDRVLALSALNFDLSVYDIFGMLAAGGCIVIPDQDNLKDPQHWWHMLDTYEITIWNSVPVLMEMLLNDSHRKELSSLRLVLHSGDWIPVSLPSRIQKQFPSAHVISMGGATEASIWSILHPIQLDDSLRSSIPYGKPMRNQVFRILKDDLSACPVWVPGELYIGGIGVAQGYWNDPQRTAESFIVHPVSGERLYRTGDFGRYLPDGNIEFLGRADTQVKIRGNRVELGEIEATLLQHPAIKEVVADVSAPNGGGKTLRAFVVPSQEKPDHSYPLIVSELSADNSTLQKLEESIQGSIRGGSPDLPASASKSFPAFWAYMGRLAVSVMWDTFAKLQIWQSPAEAYSLDEILQKGGITDHYRSLILNWLEYLVEADALICADGRYASTTAFLSDMQAELWDCDQDDYWYPKAKKLGDYFSGFGQQYVDLFTGKLDPLELLMQEDGPFTAQTMEQFNPLDGHMRDVMKAIVTNCMNALDKDDTMVVELGSRANTLAEIVLAQMETVRGVYCYTDSSSVLLDQMKARFPENGRTRYGRLDFNKDISAQGWAAHSVDILVASNTLHRAYDPQQTLTQLQGLLKPGGIVILYEGVENNPLQLVTVALFEDGFERYQNRQAGWKTLLRTAEWEAYMQQSGLTVLQTYPVDGDPVSILGQRLLLAQAAPILYSFEEGAAKDYLSAHLPEYMIPNHIYPMDALPVTPNGKVDRKALRQIGNTSGQTGAATQYQGPETQTEREVAVLWKQVLNTNQDDVITDFISSGGDSLQAVQFANLIREQYAVDFPLRIVFSGATIRSVSQYIEQSGQSEGDEYEEGEI